MKGLGITLLIAGALLAVISYFLPVSVESYSSTYLPDRIVNIGKLQVQLLVFQSGAALFLAGAIFTAAGAVIERISEVGLSPSAGAWRAGPPESVPAGDAVVVAPLPVETEEELAERRQREAELAKRDSRILLAIISVLAIGFAIAIFYSVNAERSGQKRTESTAEGSPLDNIITNIDAGSDPEPAR